MQLHTRIRIARERAGLSQRGLAKKLGVAPSTVAGWETGAHSIKAARLARFAKVTGADLAELVG